MRLRLAAIRSVGLISRVWRWLCIGRRGDASIRWCIRLLVSEVLALRSNILRIIIVVNRLAISIV